MNTTADILTMLQAAQRNSYELDRLIFEAVHMPTTWYGSKIISHFRTGSEYGFNTEDGYRHLNCVSAPNYTLTRDAALTLLPEGWGYRIERCRALVWSPDGGPLSATTNIPAAAASDALAICIATLKARAHA